MGIADSGASYGPYGRAGGHYHAGVTAAGQGQLEILHCVTNNVVDN
jgi:hypothetical protein